MSIWFLIDRAGMTRRFQPLRWEIDFDEKPGPGRAYGEIAFDARALLDTPILVTHSLPRRWGVNINLDIGEIEVVEAIRDIDLGPMIVGFFDPMYDFVGRFVATNIERSHMNMGDPLRASVKLESVHEIERVIFSQRE